MSSSSESTPRRDFIGALAASAIAIAGTACATPATATQTAPTPAPAANNGGGHQAPMPQPPKSWDDSWFSRLTAKHKAVFDSPEIGGGAALSHASGYIRGAYDALAAAPTDVQAVIVMRHRGAVMALNSAMWAKYPIAEMRNEKDESGALVKDNPYAGTPSNNPQSNADHPQANLAWLSQHGHILLVCDLATRALSSQLATKTHGDSKAIYEELKANLVPGAILQPTGVYAALRAQESGASYMRSI